MTSKNIHVVLLQCIMALLALSCNTEYDEPVLNRTDMTVGYKKIGLTTFNVGPDFVDVVMNKKVTGDIVLDNELVAKLEDRNFFYLQNLEAGAQHRLQVFERNSNVTAYIDTTFVTKYVFFDPLGYRPFDYYSLGEKEIMSACRLNNGDMIEISWAELSMAHYLRRIDSNNNIVWRVSTPFDRVKNGDEACLIGLHETKYVARIDAQSGKTIKTYRPTMDRVEIRDATLDSNGNVVIVGSQHVTFETPDKPGLTQWKKLYYVGVADGDTGEMISETVGGKEQNNHLFSVIAKKDGGCIASGMLGEPNIGTVLIGSDGSTEVTNTLTMENRRESKIRLSATDGEGNYYFYGQETHLWFYILYRPVLYKMDSQGNILWYKDFGDNLNSFGTPDFISCTRGKVILIAHDDYLVKQGYFLLVFDGDGNLEKYECLGAIDPVLYACYYLDERDDQFLLFLQNGLVMRIDLNGDSGLPKATWK